MGDSYESFYAGGISSMDPDEGAIIGFRLSPASLGFPGSSQTPNQLKETINAIKQGVKAFEVTAASPETADQIPIEHFKEMRALMKLSGVKPSMHGPIIDPAGFGQQGWEGEHAREDVERRFMSTLEKAHMLDPEGNTPVVFHSTGGSPGAKFIVGDESKGDERFKRIEDAAINVDTGEMTKLKEKRQFNPFAPQDLKGDPNKVKESGTLFTIDDSLRSVNETTWDNNLTQIANLQKQAEEVMGAAPNILNEFRGLDPKSLSEKDKEEFGNALKRMENADVFVDNMRLNITSAFDKLYEFGTDRQREELEKISKGIKRTGDPIKDLNVYGELIKGMHRITDGAKTGEADFMAPKLFKPVEDFTRDKSAKTFGNVAWKAYDKFGESTPIMAIENVFPGMVFSRAEDMKKLIEEAHDVFVANAVKNGMDRSTAKEKAKKFIGVTWDVGHLNIFKKAGFTDEDLRKQTKTIAPLVKHIHLTDNFGFGDSHLAPGMGNVPFKKHLEELEKNGEFEKMRKIVEAPAVPQHFGISPHPLTLKAFGSPIYGANMATYWNQAGGMMGSYFSGYGDSNPGVHHSIYGSGFTTLPRELGGNIPGTNSRFSGTPNA